MLDMFIYGYIVFGIVLGMIVGLIGLKLKRCSYFLYVYSYIRIDIRL